MAVNLRNRSYLTELDFTADEPGFLLDLSSDLNATQHAGTTWPLTQAHRDAGRHRVRQPQVRFLHCLPAIHDRSTTIGAQLHQEFGLDGLEVADEVSGFPASLVFEHAENRMHTVTAILVAILGADRCECSLRRAPSHRSPENTMSSSPMATVRRSGCSHWKAPLIPR